MERGFICFVINKTSEMVYVLRIWFLRTVYVCLNNLPLFVDDKTYNIDYAID